MRQQTHCEADLSSGGQHAPEGSHCVTVLCVLQQQAQAHSSYVRAMLKKRHAPGSGCHSLLVGQWIRSPVTASRGQGSGADTGKEQPHE